jgi:hypothetical protein
LLSVNIVKTHPLHFFVLVALAIGSGCQFSAIRNGREAEPRNKYAELRLGSDDRMQVLICADVWRGQFFTPEGPRWVENYLYYWVTLRGRGPDYIDPIFHKNSPIPSEPHVGTITVDQQKREVTINLRRVVSKPGEPQRTEPSPANGTYPIKKTNRDAFLEPQ